MFSMSKCLWRNFGKRETFTILTFVLFLSHSLPTLLHGRVQKSRAGGQAGQGDRGEDGAGTTTDPGLRRDQVGPLAATDHPEERGYSQTVNWAVSPPAVSPASPDSSPYTLGWSVKESLCEKHGTWCWCHSQRAQPSEKPPTECLLSQTLDLFFFFFLLTVAVT